MDFIEKYYNKFNEDKRLQSRHGVVEFTISLEYITKYLNKLKKQKKLEINSYYKNNGEKDCNFEKNNEKIANNVNNNQNNYKNISLKILDVGAGTGRYSSALYNLGYDVTAVEYVKKNLSVLKQNYPQIKAHQGSALNLYKFKDEEFDAVILFGPMYHLFSFEDKLKALIEAKRVTKKGGVIFVAYLLNNYAIIRHGFMDKNILQSAKCGKVDKKFNITSSQEDLYSYINLKDVERLNKTAGLKRKQLISPDGPTDYIRPYINKLTQEEFELYIDFVRQNAANKTQIGASSHIVDILIKN